MIRKNTLIKVICRLIYYVGMSCFACLLLTIITLFINSAMGVYIGAWVYGLFLMGTWMLSSIIVTIYNRNTIFKVSARMVGLKTRVHSDSYEVQKERIRRKKAVTAKNVEDIRKRKIS